MRWINRHVAQIPWRQERARGGERTRLFLVEVRSVIRNRLFTLSFLGSFALVFFLLSFAVLHDDHTEPGMRFMWIALLAGVPAGNYAGYCIGKDALYLEGLFTRLTLRNYVAWKVSFSRAYTAVYAAGVFPLVLFESSNEAIAFCALTFYYLGFGGLFLLLAVSFGTTRIDLHVSPFFTMQQTSILGALAMIPVTAPAFFLGISPSWGLGATCVVGAMGFVFSGPIQFLIEKNLARRKYRLLGL